MEKIPSHKKQNPTLFDVLEAIQALSEKMDTGFLALEARMEKLEWRMDQIEARMTALEKRVGTLEQRVINLEQQLVALEGRIHVLEEEISALKLRLGEIELKLDSVDNKLSRVNKRSDEDARAQGETLIRFSKRLKTLELRARRSQTRASFVASAAQ